LFVLCVVWPTMLCPCWLGDGKAGLLYGDSSRWALTRCDRVFLEVP